MKGLLFGLSMAVLVTAKPELYKEKEDFQYSRSSSDEGSKSGYYDAQRGNMGGNYERAHNMDGLAQHQMGGLVKQVEGELGDGSKTRTGSVFTAANSQGIYGSGRYDLSNLDGRNFQEGTTFHDSQSYSSARNRAHSSQYSTHNNGRYNTNSQSHSSGFGDIHQSDNLQEAQNTYGTKEYEHGSESQRRSKYYLQSGYQGSSDYERSNINHQASNNFEADTHNRFISQVPVRIVVRPGTRVAIPLATQTNSGSHAASYDQSSVNNEAEVLNSGDQQVAFRPNSDAKHYESSYSYRKEWEKHDTKPAAVPLATPVFPISKNSELYDESRLHHGSGYTQNTDYNLASSHNRQQSGFNSQHSASSSDSRHQADYNAQQHTASSNLNSNAYSHSGYETDANSPSANIIGTITSKPKSYQSSYSYHKSWERQGDPYVIIPPSNGAYAGQTSQRLTDVSGLQADYSSHNYGSRKSHQTYSIKDCVIECDPNSHIRIDRSYNSDPAQFEDQNQNLHDGQETSKKSPSGWEEIQNLDPQIQNSWDNSGQQTQNKWENLEDLGQQTQNNWGNLEQLGQQTQNKWEQQIQDAGQQVQNKWDTFEDLGQQVQNKSEQQTQDARQQIENNSDNLEDLGQQTQNNWEQAQDARQQIENKSDKLEDLGQQTQNNWELQAQDAGQQIENKSENLEDLGQQTQNNWEPQAQDAKQQIENKSDKLEDLRQQTQNNWEQQAQDAGQQIENKSDNLEDLGQQTQNNWEPQAQDARQQIENISDKLEDLGQQTQNKWEEQTQEAGQQVQNKWDYLGDLGQDTQNKWEQSQDGQLAGKKWDLGQQTQSQLGGEINTGQDILNGWNNLEAFGQQSEMGQNQQIQDNWDTQKQEVHTKPIEIEDLSQQNTQAKWGPLEEREQKQEFSYEGTQQAGYEKFDKAQDGLGWWPNQFKLQEKPFQTVDLNQQTQGFDLQQTQTFENQNDFEQTINQDKSQGQSFLPEDLSQHTQGPWNHFEKEFLNNNARPSNGNIDSNNPVSIINNETSTKKPASQNNTQGPKNTGSLNSLWGKLDDLDEDIALPNHNTYQTQNKNFSQISSSHGLWGKLDDLDGDIAPSSVNTLQTQNTDFSQISNSHYNWQQQSLFNHETSSNFAQVSDQHFNNHRYNNFEMWSLTNKQKNNMTQFDNTFEVFEENSTTENGFLVTGLLINEKNLITTTEKSNDEDNIRTIDFGRGDIGPEDSVIDLSTSTTAKISLKDDNFSQYTTEIDNNQQYKSPNEEGFLIPQGELMNEPTRKIIHILDEQPSPKPFHFQKITERPSQDDLQNYNKPSNKPYKAAAGNNEAPEEIEQQYETQNVQQEFKLHNEHKIDFEQAQLQHQNSEQNTDFVSFDGNKPELWKQDLSQQQTSGDFADKPLVDFSQTNQQWHSEQQNIQQQFPNDFYQQNQHSQFQNGDFEPPNVESTLPDLGQQNIKREFEILPTNEPAEKNVRTDYVEDFGQQPKTYNILEKNVSATPQPVTENPGFWKSVGNKFVSAKKKVASWFS